MGIGSHDVCMAKFAAFQKKGAVILGVSRDTLISHQHFCEKYGLRYFLLSDVDETICRSYDVLTEKIIAGKKSHGIERSTFLINSEGNIQKVWRGVKVKGHVNEVLAALS